MARLLTPGTPIAAIRSIASVAVLLAIAGCTAPQLGQLEGTATASEFQGRELRAIHIEVADVFAEEEASERPLYRLLNSLHVTTLERTVQRELWMRPGDTLHPEMVREIERNLRRTGLFSEVEGQLEPVQGEDTVDLRIRTRDRFSFTAGASGFSAGGVDGFNLNLGENNLFGKGDALTASLAENSEGETSGGISYLDRHFLGTRKRLRLSAGETDEGQRFSMAFDRPLWHLEDDWSWGASFGFSESDTDYFEGGDTIAEVPLESTSFSAFLSHTRGPRNERTGLGLELTLSDESYGVATGPGAVDIEVPGDTTKVTLGPYVRYDWINRFDRLEFVDSLGFVEDVQLGYRAELFAGGQLRDEAGFDERIEPLLFAGLRSSHEVLEETFLTLSGTGSLRWYAGESQGYAANAALHAYHLGFERQTLAASLSFDRVFEGADLPVELTLGEDNGLRGYPAREFSGSRRVRFNFEDRIDTGLEFRTVRLGLVPFFDTAWIGDNEWGSPLASVGLGLRIGSSEIFGRGVLRFDLAFPLTEVGGESFDPSLSIALGQVFTFFGNSSLLSSR